MEHRVSNSYIHIRGAKTHNLKNISLDIPRDKFVVITGVSGSGKSSLTFDTIYAEGQRRYVESLSSYARQFLHMMDKPDVDLITGLSPAISIDQKTCSHNPRSTVGTVTEIYDYLRLLFARVGIPYSPETGLPIEAQSVDQMIDRISELKEKTKFYLLAPVFINRKGEFKSEFDQFRKQGFQRVFVDQEIYDIDALPSLNKNVKHTVSLVVDRMIVPQKELIAGAWRTRLAGSLETALRLTKGIVWIQPVNSSENKLILSENFACPVSGFSLEEIEPRLFSFNGPEGACPQCKGLGFEYQFDVYKIIDWNLSLKQGAIKCLTGEKDSVYRLKYVRSYYQKLIEAVALQFNIPLTLPFSSLTNEQKDILLYGTGNVPVPLKITAQSTLREYKFNKPFEGVINILNRRINEDEHETVRDMLSPIQTKQICSKCHGTRLKPEALCVRINQKNIADITTLSVDEALSWFNHLHLSDQKAKIAERILQEISNRLTFLKDVGLDYLTLSRSADTLSGGESQRIRLASQIGSGLSGVLYVLDEPSIGLHQRDNDRLLQTIKHLRDLGNSVIVVEHDEDAIRQADYVIDMGPMAGIYGGEVIAAGPIQEVLKNPNSLTADYLTGRKAIKIPEFRRPINLNELYSTNKQSKKASKKLLDRNKMLEVDAFRGKGLDPKNWGNVPWLTLKGACINNLKDLDVSIPLGRFVCVTGVSGSGKSSLIMECLFKNLSNKLNKKSLDTSLCQDVIGAESIDKIIDIDQTPIGRTPRSNPATYVGCFTAIRDWFAELPESKARGYGPGRFSFNIKGGRCESCQGDGLLKIEMHFLPDVYVPCDQCRGKRYNQETLSIRYKDKNISDILNMSIDEGVSFFENHLHIWNKLKKLQEVGLGYLTIGHPANLLSGGEAQRVKLAKELCRKATGKTLYVLDEPTTGLHFEDIRKLVDVLNTLVNQGNSLVIIEHNLDIIKMADWIIDLGPEGGCGGGELVAQGTPEDIVKNPRSFTGKYLASYLEKAKAS